MAKRRLVYYVAASLDGFIADARGSTRAFATDPEYVAALAELLPETMPPHVRRDLDNLGPHRRFDAVLLGRRTHQLALDAGMTSMYPDLQQHVFTHRNDLPADETVLIHRGRALDIVSELKGRTGRDIWLCGGGDLAAQLCPVIDELLLRVNPVVLRDGVPLLRGSRRAGALPSPFNAMAGQRGVPCPLRPRRSLT